MSHPPGTWRPAAGLRRPGASAWEGEFYAHDLGRPALPSIRAGKASGTEAAMRETRRCWCPIEADPSGIPWDGRSSPPQGLGSASGLRDIRWPAAGAGFRNENNRLCPIAPPPWQAIPMPGEMASLMPANLMWGTDGVRVFTVDDGWGWIFGPPSALERRVCRLASASVRPLRRPAAGSPWGCRAVRLDRMVAALAEADALRDGITAAQYLSKRTALDQPIKFCGHRSRAAEPCVQPTGERLVLLRPGAPILAAAVRDLRERQWSSSH